MKRLMQVIWDEICDAAWFFIALYGLIAGVVFAVWIGVQSERWL